MSRASLIAKKSAQVANVWHIDELPTYYDLHGKRQLKILFDDEVGRAKYAAVEYITYQKGDEVRMHKHEDSEHAFIILKGIGFFECDTGRYPIRKGSVMFMPKGANHRIGNDGDGELVLLEVFAPPTAERKAGLATCYSIPKWNRHFDRKMYDEKKRFAEKRGIESKAPPVAGKSELQKK
jgi:mannose-6-phosphate isomerase-like protein (cupin superfamily)